MPKKTTPARSHLTIAEAARELGVCRSRVHQLIARHGIPVERPSPKLTLIPRESFERLRKIPRVVGFPKGGTRRPRVTS